MTFPSATLLAQSALSGVFIGSLYGLLGLGLGLSWGLLHIINLAHFGFAFLAAYLCYQLASVGGMDPLLTLVLIVPLFFVLGVAVQWLLARFAVSPLNSLLATFGLTAIIEAGIQADLDRRLPQARVGRMRARSFASARCSFRCPSCSRWRCALVLTLRHLGGDALHRPGPRAARAGRGRAGRRGVRRQPPRACARAGGRLRRAGRRRRRVPRAELHAHAVADLRLGRRGVRGGDAGRARLARSVRSPPASSSASARR